jgi:hypothetical protein
MAYTRGELKERINAGIKGKRGMLSDFDGTINDTVRSVTSDVLDLRSLRRRSLIAPGLFDDVFSYPLPVDLKGNRIVSIHSQDLTNTYRRYSLIPFEDFGEQRKVGTIAINDHDQVRKLLISSPITNSNMRVSTLDALNSGGGTWGIFGTTTEVVADQAFYVYGSGSLRFDIGAAIGTTAGIVNSTLDVFDFSAHLEQTSSAFVFVYIPNAANITGFTLRIGQDSTHYHAVSATQTHFGTAFVSGWNLVRFDMANKTTVGTVDATDGRYVAIILDKATTKVSETGYRFDNLVLGTGTPQFIYYYSQYPWIDSVTGARVATASRDGDILVADEDEYSLFVYKGIELAGVEVDEFPTSQYAMQMFNTQAAKYGRDYPSEAMLMTTDYQAQFYI